MIGLVGVFREHVFTTTIYWAFCIANCTFILVLYIYREPFLIVFIILVYCVTEAIAVGLFLGSLYQLRKARKMAAIRLEYVVKAEVVALE